MVAYDMDGLRDFVPNSNRRPYGKKKAPPGRGLRLQRTVACQLLNVARSRQVGRRDRGGRRGARGRAVTERDAGRECRRAANPDHILVKVETGREGQHVLTD